MNGRHDPHEADPLGRTEPTLGNLDQLDTLATEAPGKRARQPSPKAASPRGDAPTPRRWLLPTLLGLAVVVLLVLGLGRSWLGGMVPRTDFNDVLSRAQAALQQGHLDGNDGTSARELFQAAVALEPDNDAARNGLRQVGMAEVSQADAALQAGKLDDAAQAAAVARELLGGGSDVDRLDQMIATHRNAGVQVDVLVQQAQQAFAAGQYTGEAGAGALYRKVLAADPGNAVARHGLDQVGDALATQAKQAQAANDSTTADTLIQQLAALQPNNAALPGLHAAHTEASQTDNAALDTALQQGDAALRAGRIDGDGNDTALAYYHAAQALAPNDPRVQAGLGQVAQALTVQANAEMDAGAITQAITLLDHAQTLAPKSADIAAARARLQSITGGHAAASAGSGETHAPAANSAAANNATTNSAPAANDGFLHPPLSPAQSAQLAQYLQRAQAALQRGDIMMPPGNCAYDLYRNALAIDGNNVQAQQALEALPGTVRKLFGQALAAGQLAQAGNMLDNLADLAPGDASLAPLRQRLADAWLDAASQQLTVGDRAAAAQSLDQARKLAPNHPRLQELTARLQAGS